MLDNLKLGYGGTASEMARLINDSGVLGKTTKVTAKTVNNVSFDKIIEAIHTIQTNLDISGISMEEYTELVESGAMSQEEAFKLLGTSAKEGSTTLQGSFAMTKSAWDNLITGLSDPKADIGELIDNLVESGSAALDNLLPILERAFDSLGTFIEKAVPKIVERLPELVEKLLPELLKTASDLLLKLAEALPDLFPIIVDTALQLFDEIATKMGEQFPVLEPVFDVLKSALGFISTVGESAGAALKSIWDNFLQYVVGFAAETFGAFMTLIADVLERISQNETAVAVLTTILTLIGSITAACYAYQGAMWLVNTAQNAAAVSGGILNAVWAANPIGVIIAAVAGLIALIVEIIVYWDDLVLIWETFVDEWTTGIQAIGKWFSDLFKPITDFFSGIGQLIFDFFSGIGQSIFDALKPFIDAIGQWFAEIGQWFANLWESIANIFSGVGQWFGDRFNEAWEYIKNSFLFLKIVEFSKGLWESIANIFSGIGQWFGDRFNEAWEGIKNAFSKVGEFFKGLWDGIISTFQWVGQAVGDAIGGAFKAAMNLVIGVVEGALNLIPAAINGAIWLINEIPGVNIPSIPLVQLPRLAQGGVLKKGQVGLLEGSGDEAVVPLSQNTEWIDKVAERLNQNANTAPNNYYFYFNIDKVSGNAEDLEENADRLMQIFTEKMAQRGRVFA